jgi:hypothetical protein
MPIEVLIFLGLFGIILGFDGFMRVGGFFIPALALRVSVCFSFFG